MAPRHMTATIDARTVIGMDFVFTCILLLKKPAPATIENPLCLPFTKGRTFVGFPPFAKGD
jgi:hypothetical protein